MSFLALAIASKKIQKCQWNSRKVVVIIIIIGKVNKVIRF